MIRRFSCTTLYPKPASPRDENGDDVTVTYDAIVVPVSMDGQFPSMLMPVSRELYDAGMFAGVDFKSLAKTMRKVRTYYVQPRRRGLPAGFQKKEQHDEIKVTPCIIKQDGMRYVLMPFNDGRPSPCHYCLGRSYGCSCSNGLLPAFASLSQQIVVMESLVMVAKLSEAEGMRRVALHDPACWYLFDEHDERVMCYASAEQFRSLRAALSRLHTSTTQFDTYRPR